MKKLMIIAFILLLCVGFTGCGKNVYPTKTENITKEDTGTNKEEDEIWNYRPQEETSTKTFEDEFSEYKESCIEEVKNKIELSKENTDMMFGLIYETWDVISGAEEWDDLSKTDEYAEFIVAISYFYAQYDDGVKEKEIGKTGWDYVESLINNDKYKDKLNTFKKACESVDNNIFSGETILKDKQGKICYSYSGTGDDVVTGFTSDDEYCIAHIRHNGTGHFAVKGHYDDTYDLLVNTTDPYDGFTLIYPNKEYMFEVTAKEEWEIEIISMGTSSVDSFSGSGDFVTPIFVSTSNAYEIKTNGGGHFAIKGWTDNDYDLLVNTTDENYSGKIMFENKGEYAFFEITASREWEIKPVK